MEFDACHKLLLIGDASCGKSSLVARFVDSEFNPKSQATVGVDFRISSVTIGGKQIKLHLWDTTGNKRFRSITASYYRVAHAVLVCVDTSSEESLESAGGWLQAVEQFCAPGTPVLLVGTKADLGGARAFDRRAAQRLAASVGGAYHETSAATGEGVSEAFLAAAAAIAKNDRTQKHRRQLIRAGGRSTVGHSYCCMPWLSLSYWLASSAASHHPQRIATAQLAVREGQGHVAHGGGSVAVG